MSSTYSFPVVDKDNEENTQNSVDTSEDRLERFATSETTLSQTWHETAPVAQIRMEAQTETITLDEAIDAVMSKAAAVMIAVEQATMTIAIIGESINRVTSPKSVDEAWGFMKEVVKHTTTAWDEVWSATRALQTAAIVAETEDRDKWQAIHEARTAVQAVVVHWHEATRASEAAYEAWANIFYKTPKNWDVTAIPPESEAAYKAWANILNWDVTAIPPEYVIDPTEAASLQADDPQTGPQTDPQTVAMSLIQKATHATNAAQETISKAAQAWNEANANIFVVASPHTRSTFAQAMIKVAAATKAVDEATTVIAQAQILPPAVVSWDKIKQAAEQEIEVTTKAYDQILETVETCRAAYHLIQTLSQNRGETWKVASQVAMASMEDWEKARAATEAVVGIWKQTSTQPDPYAAHRSICQATQITDTAIKAVSQATQSWKKVNPKILLAISNITSTDISMK
jgi:hypothetical protein